MEVSSIDNSNLFNVLERGDRYISTAQKNAIMLVGLTRAGKSTTYNWILGRQMIGVGDQIEAHYENVINDANSAQLGDTFTSVTLCPNISELDAQRKIMLMDMAGYKDKRDFIGVLGVSYFLKAVFERVEKVKFVIVLDEHKLTQQSGDGLIDTFTGFLNMFNLKQITKQYRQMFYNSISVMITRAQKQVKHQSYLRRISNMIKDKKLQVENKQELLLLFEDIISKNRIEAFPMAKGSHNPPKCDFIERFDKLGWDFFDFPTAQRNLSTQLISLPFQNDFNDLKQQQKDKFGKCILTKVNSYVDFSDIVSTLIHSIKDNWENSINDFNITGKLELNLGRCPDLFEKVDAFLQANDFYNSGEQVIPEVKTEYQTLNFVASIRQILKIYDFIDSINDLGDSNFIMNMASYSELFGQLINQLIAFAGSQNDEHLLLRLIFVIKRGFREFSKLYQLSPGEINDVNQKMKDNCNNIFKEGRYEFLQLFIKKIDERLIQALFPHLQDLLEYEALFCMYAQNFKDRQDQELLSHHRFSLDSAKARLGLDGSNKKEALKNFIAAYRSVCEVALVARNNENQDVRETKLNQIHMSKLKIISNITRLLKNYQDFAQAKNYALAFNLYIKDIHEVCQIYELIIAEAKGDTKTELLYDYAKYCLEWGRLQQAASIFQRKLSLERSNFGNYMETIKKLSTISMDKDRYIQIYQENLQSWSRLPEDDPTINSHFDGLQGQLDEL